MVEENNMDIYLEKSMPNVVYILNFYPTKVMRNLTSHEVWFHWKPNVTHLKVQNA